MLKARLNEANRAKIMAVRSDQDLQLEYNRIRLHLLEWIDDLEADDFNVVEQRLKPRGRGVLLHQIPRQMEVDKEEVCVIRLAYDRSVIADNLELTDAVEVKEVTVSEVMEAELIDPNSEPAFRIRTYHDERQFLEAGAYTEWKFYVEPIREGTFRLLLKLTVIEEVMGERERRNITWEEQVQIVTEAETAAPASFRESGIALSAPGASPLSPTLTGGATPGAPATPRSAGKKTAKTENQVFPPQAETANPVPSPAVPKVRNLVRRLSVAASVVLVVGFGGWYLLSSEYTNAPDAPKKNDPDRAPTEVVEPAAPSVSLPAGVQRSAGLSGRKPLHTEALPPRPKTTAVFEVCIATSGKVVEVVPAEDQADDRAWTGRMVQNLKAWTFETGCRRNLRYAVLYIRII